MRERYPVLLSFKRKLKINFKIKLKLTEIESETNYF